MRGKYIFILAGLLLLIPVLPVRVSTDTAFVDQNTGSRHGYREWFWGGRTKVWRRTSALETFMREKHAQMLQQQWVRYQGTGRNILGIPVVHEHGRPGPIIMLHVEFIDEYCALVSDDQKMRLYEIFSSGDSKLIREVGDEMFATLEDGRNVRPATTRSSQ